MLFLHKEAVVISTYVISDIHGQYNAFMELIEKIGIKETDNIYILGDILDRGPHPIKVLRKLMDMPNVICLVGNHELMALKCLGFLMNEITNETIEQLDENVMKDLIIWQNNGGRTTIYEFIELSMEEKQDVIDYINEFLVYEEVTVNNQDYLLVHAGLGNYSPDKEIEDYSLHDLIWTRADYSKQYFEDKIVITGHTPTQRIKDNPRPGFIYKNKNHIAVDCGACYSGGRLAAICLDTGETFYSTPKELYIMIPV